MIKIIIIFICFIYPVVLIQETLNCRGLFPTLNQNDLGPIDSFFDGNSRIMKNQLNQEELWIIGGNSFSLIDRSIFKINLGISFFQYLIIILLKIFEIFNEKKQKYGKNYNFPFHSFLDFFQQ